MKRQNKDHYQAIIETFIWDDNVSDAVVDAGGTIRVNQHWWDRLDAVGQKKVIDNWDQFKNRLVMGVYK